MFCYQCEQTVKGQGCTNIGVCGKTAEVSSLQDLLIYLLKGAAFLANANELDKNSTVSVNDFDLFVYEALFATVTNVDFDAERLIPLIKKADQFRQALFEKLHLSVEDMKKLPDACTFKLNTANNATMIKQGAVFKIIDQTDNIDIQSLKNTLLFGIKGIAAYADHAAVLGENDRNISLFLQKALAYMLRHDLSMTEWVDLVMECGQINLQTMKLLDKANTGHYGQPTPTQVPLGAKKGKAILISGHDLRDLELLLKQTVGKNIYIYTHGEMLPAHGYPKLKKYAHFYGHYGTAWQNQHQEFAAFPGAILMTTNCIQKPLDSYKDRIFTTGLVAWPGVLHIDSKKDFTPVINKALELPGFIFDRDKDFVVSGFARNAVLSVADKIAELVKAKKIRHFFLVAGCDGAKPGRNYYTEFVEKVPNDCLVLTLACGKFRFFDKKLGNIAGIPRLLDIGQCNDAYSAIQIALALANAFNCSVNELPLSMILSWYEQKAVAILLTLLSLGIKNIRLGPTLPAFLSPNVLNFLVEKFQVKLISTPDQDLKDILGE
ncbi:MAG: hydroxylamine reductase [Gammaproteobacteria bacterium]|nr:hydroxylamine reductase [Gammaproteobacteria bacterium]